MAILPLRWQLMLWPRILLPLAQHEPPRNRDVRLQLHIEAFGILVKPRATDVGPEPSLLGIVGVAILDDEDFVAGLWVTHHDSPFHAGTARKMEGWSDREPLCEQLGSSTNGDVLAKGDE